jgi:hypothetical protein
MLILAGDPSLPYCLHSHSSLRLILFSSLKQHVNLPVKSACSISGTNELLTCNEDLQIAVLRSTSTSFCSIVLVL